MRKIHNFQLRDGVVVVVEDVRNYEIQKNIQYFGREIYNILKNKNRGVYFFFFFNRLLSESVLAECEFWFLVSDGGPV